MEPIERGGSFPAETPATEESLLMVQRLEMLKISDEDRRQRQRSLSASPTRAKGKFDPEVSSSSSSVKVEGELSERHRLQILQAMGQSVHVSDAEGRIVYW